MAKENTRNVLVGVDIQNDFITGSLAVNEGDRVVTPLNNVAKAIRQSGGHVVYTRDWHPAKTPHFADFGGQWPVHCVADTKGAEFHPNLDVQPGDIIISKGTGQTDGYSGWEGASDEGKTLESIITPETLRERVTLYIGGLATDFCVRATALDIAEHFQDDERVRIYLLRDAVRAVGLTPTAEEEALAAMKEVDVLAIPSTEAIAMIEGSVQ